MTKSRGVDGKTIRKLRLANGLSIAHMCVACDCTENSYRGIERGLLRDPKISTILGILDAFKLGFEDLPMILEG